jgi:hypothetical protein
VLKYVQLASLLRGYANTNPHGRIVNGAAYSSSRETIPCVFEHEKRGKQCGPVVD